MIGIRFDNGTLVIDQVAKSGPEANLLPSDFVWDKRINAFRAPAIHYAQLLLALSKAGIKYEDKARQYTELTSGLLVHRTPRPYQSESITAWNKNRGRGMVVLPTGSGKSHVAVMAIDTKRRSTLVVAPTLDLVRQWYDLLSSSFDCPVGIVGGGHHDVEALTVTTYDSAYIHMEHMGGKFGLIVFDEAHHLPGETYSLSALASIAPYRLGLSATPERADGMESRLDELIGKVVYRQDIVELTGEYLSDYETVRVAVEFSADERAEYEAARSVYKAFLSRSAINFSRPDGWSQFIRLSARSDAGRAAMAAYRKQRNLAFSAPAKLKYVEHLLHEHRSDRSILFTQDNRTAYQISKQFLIPIITHQTKVKERSEILKRLADGVYRAVVTSKVLNEGVDVPDANVAIIVSGSGSVREHVQRLGRVLRKREGKRAILYEMVTANTSEQYTSERRRDHSAYSR